MSVLPDATVKLPPTVTVVAPASWVGNELAVVLEPAGKHGNSVSRASGAGKLTLLLPEQLPQLGVPRQWWAYIDLVVPAPVAPGLRRCHCRTAHRLGLTWRW